MDKKYVMAGLLVVIIAVILFAKSIVKVPVVSEKTGCDWRPTYEERTNCLAENHGFYYNGKNCIDVKACTGRVPPFKTIEECKEACVK